MMGKSNNTHPIKIKMGKSNNTPERDKWRAPEPIKKMNIPII